MASYDVASIICEALQQEAHAAHRQGVPGVLGVIYVRELLSFGFRVLGLVYALANAKIRKLVDGNVM